MKQKAKAVGSGIGATLATFVAIILLSVAGIYDAALVTLFVLPGIIGFGVARSAWRAPAEADTSALR